MDVTFGLRRALTCCLRSGPGVLSNETLVSGQPDGDLRSFMASKFKDGEAAEAAFRDAGGTIIVRATAGEVSAVGFTIDEAGRLCLSVTAPKGSAVELRLAIPHSVTH
jgi:hypothetical protein